MEFLILGPLEVRDGERTVRLGAAKQRALLGVLLLHANETVSTSRLVDELWGEQPPATAVNLVQGYVHALRRQLGDGVVQTSAPGYRISVEAGSLDLLEFERLVEAARGGDPETAVELRREALALWRGTPLGDVELQGPDRHTQARLAELRLATQVDRIDAELAVGRHAEVVGELEALVAEHPYQERAAGLLMLALYRSGRQADALEAYRTVRGRLSDELGLQPGKELRDLEAAILRQDEALAAPVVPAPSVVKAAPTEHEPSLIPATRRRRRVALGGALALLAAATAAVAVFVLRDDASVIVPPNSVAVIDVDRNRVESFVPVEKTPGPVAAGAGYVWVGNLDDKSLSRIDPANSEGVERIDLDVTPHAVTADGAAAWVMNGKLGALYRVDATSRQVSDPISLGDTSFRMGAGVDVGEGWVWAGFGDATLARVDLGNLDTREAVRSTAAGPTALVVADDYVWVANATAAAELQQFSPEILSPDPVKSYPLGCAPSGIAAGDGAVWVACRDDDVVMRIATDLFGTPRRITVGAGPRDVAFGGDAVWVANGDDGTVSRIDPETEKVETIEVGGVPAGIAFLDGRVWVSVQAPLTP